MKYWLPLILSGFLALSAFISPSVAKDRGVIGNVKRMLFPPRDLFALIAKIKLDISKTNEATWSKIKVSYDGPYSFGILLENLTSENYFEREPKSIDLQLELEFYENNEPIFATRSNTTMFLPFLGLRGNGLKLGTFETPEDIPLNTEIKCKTNIIAIDDKLQNEYGPVWLYIQKDSEK